MEMRVEDDPIRSDRVARPRKRCTPLQCIVHAGFMLLADLPIGGLMAVFARTAEYRSLLYRIVVLNKIRTL